MAMQNKQNCDLDGVVIVLQEFRQKSGITDIEIRGDNLHVIIEAKRAIRQCQFTPSLDVTAR